MAYVTTQVTWTFSFERGELRQLTNALLWAAEAPSAARRVNLIRRMIHAGEPMTRQQVDDLRVWYVRWLKSSGNADGVSPLADFLDDALRNRS